MKTKIKTFILWTAMSTLVVSCGKNSTGSDSKSGGSGDIPAFTQNTVQSVKLSTVQEKFAKLNVKSNGIKAGDVVYHYGPAFAVQQSGSSINLQVSGCINLIFTQIGNCNNNNYGTAYFDSIVKAGSYLEIQSVSTNSLNFRRAIGENHYNSGEFSKSNDVLYKEMLALDANSIFASPKVSVASVTLTDGRKVEAYLVERFDNIGRKYVVSPNLPLIANPVAILDAYGNFNGVLVKSGTGVNIRQIQVNYHTINHYNGGTPIPAGYKQFQVQ